jgi:hypothetical protein
MGSVTDGPTIQDLAALSGGSGGGGGGPGPQPDYSAMLQQMQAQQQPNADAMRNQFAQMMMPQMQGGGGGGGAWWMDPRLQNASFGTDPYAASGQPSGSVTDVGWMNAMQPWQGGVSSGGQPGANANPYGVVGGGSMARYALPSFGGDSIKYLPGGGIDQNDPNNIATYYRLMGMGGGMGPASYGGFSGGGANYGGVASGGGGRGGNNGPSGNNGPNGNNANQGYSGVAQGPANPSGTVTRGADLADLSSPMSFGPTSGWGTVGPNGNQIGYANATGLANAGYWGGSTLADPVGWAGAATDAYGNPSSNGPFGSNQGATFGTSSDGPFGGSTGTGYGGLGANGGVW